MVVGLAPATKPHKQGQAMQSLLPLGISLLIASQSYDGILDIPRSYCLIESLVLQITPVFVFYVGYHRQTIYHVWHSHLVVVLMISNTKLFAVLFLVSFSAVNKNVEWVINLAMVTPQKRNPKIVSSKMTVSSFQPVNGKTQYLVNQKISSLSISRYYKHLWAIKQTLHVLIIYGSSRSISSYH